MALRSGINAPAVLIEKYINSAYDTVKSVADNINAVTTVGNYLNDPDTAGDITAVADAINGDVAAAQAAAATATSASNTAVNAASEATEALDEFKNIYLGPFSSAEVVEAYLAANAMTKNAGDMYFNSVNTTMYVWAGNTWQTLGVFGVTKQVFTATAGQTVFGLTNGVTYIPGSNNIQVFVDGLLKIVDPVTAPGTQDYVEAAENTIVFNSPLSAGQEVVLVIGEFLSNTQLGVTTTTQRILATAGQTVVPVNSYVQGIGNIRVYVNGVHQYSGTSYSETTSTTITFSEPLELNDEIVVIKGDILTNITMNTKAETEVFTISVDGTTEVELQNLAYLFGNQNLQVYLNGSKQIVDVSYTENPDGTTITFLTGLNVGDVVECVVGNLTSTVQHDVTALVDRLADYESDTGSSYIGYTPAGTGAVSTTVESKLREFVSVKDFGAVGNGVTNDKVAIQAALNYAKTLSEGMDEGTSVVVDLHGKAYALESGISFISGGEGITLQNGRLIATGAGWATTDYMVTMEEWAARSRLLNVMVDCNKKASGVDIKCGRGRIDDCEVHHFRGIGINLSSTVAGDSRVFNTTVYEWSNGDAEFTNNNNYVAVGININRADQEIRDCIVKWCNTCFYLGPNTATTTIIGCHPYNGGAGQTVASAPWSPNTAYYGGEVVTPTVPNGKYYSCSDAGISGSTEPVWNATTKSITTDSTTAWRCLTTSTFVRYHPKLVVAERGAGAMFVGCYLDDGEIDLYGDQIGVVFESNRVLYNYAVAHMNYFIGLFAANGTPTLGESVSGPWKFHARGWEYASIDLFDGTLPFIKKFNYLDNWLGSDANFVAATGYKDMLENWHVSKCQMDDEPVITLHTPHNNGVGARLALSDSDTTSPPYICSSGNYLTFSKPYTLTGTAITTNKTYTTGEDVGTFIGVNNSTTNITITFPKNEKSGTRREFQLNGTGKITLNVESGATFRPPYGGTATSIVIQNRQYSRLTVVCVGGSTDTAIYGFHLDGYEYARSIGSVTTSTTLAVGAYEGGLINVNNGATAVTVTLPNSNYVGYKTTLHVRGSAAVIIAVESGGAITSAGVGTTRTLSQYSTVEIICVANSSGTAANYAFIG